MTALTTKLTSGLRRFKSDRRGMEVIQSVLIVAMSAIMLIGLMKFFDTDVKKAVNKMIDQLTSQTSTMGGGAGS